MAKTDNNILDTIKNEGLATPSAGFRVPEGFFDSFVDTMADSLPYRPEIEEATAPARPRTLWQKVRPYAYMAAMFAGIWCTISIFTAISGTSSKPMSENPVIADALSEDEFMRDNVYGDLNSWDIVDEMFEDSAFADDAEPLFQSLDSIDTSSFVLPQ